jgi:hypothetical protein
MRTNAAPSHAISAGQMTPDRWTNRSPRRSNDRPLRSGFRNPLVAADTRWYETRGDHEEQFNVGPHAPIAGSHRCAHPRDLPDSGDPHHRTGRLFGRAPSSPADATHRPTGRTTPFSASISIQRQPRVTSSSDASSPPQRPSSQCPPPRPSPPSWTGDPWSQGQPSGRGHGASDHHDLEPYLRGHRQRHDRDLRHRVGRPGHHPERSRADRRRYAEACGRTDELELCLRYLSPESRTAPVRCLRA